VSALPYLPPLTSRHCWLHYEAFSAFLSLLSSTNICILTNVFQIMYRSERKLKKSVVVYFSNSNIQLDQIAWRVRCVQEETSESLYDKDMAMVVGTITTQTTRKVGPATKHKSGVQIGARKGERYNFEGQHNIYFLPGNIQGRFARFLHLAGCDVAQDWSLLVSGT
jgi:hypothetical protein